MIISRLQKYILLQSLGSKKNIDRKFFRRYYESVKIRPGSNNLAKIITQSTERLIDKGLMIGFGRRTPHKWFITETKLTIKGRKLAKKLLGEQQELPFCVKFKKK
ncbi:MAG: hypothetical protein WCW02_04045 [Candidatus Buchananbacteria bacterium]